MTNPKFAKNLVGAGRVYELPNDRYVPSVTNLIGQLSKPALVPWAAKVVANEAVNNLEKIQTMDAQEAVSYLKATPNRNRDNAGARGTEIHKAIEENDRTKYPDYIDGVNKYLDTQGILELFGYEQTRVAHDYAGTADILYRNAQSKVVLADWKTGSGPWPEQSLQLQALAAAHQRLMPDQTLVKALDVDELHIVLLREGGIPEVYRVQWDDDTRIRTKTLMSGLAEVWQWKRIKEETERIL